MLHKYNDQIGPTGLPVEPVLPSHPTADHIKEVLEMWLVPRDAYPEAGGEDVNYKLKKRGHKQCIHVHLRRQPFVTFPKHTKHSYFSFFRSGEYELGPVQDAIDIGKIAMHEGYNHCTATLAWGEAKMLAEWVDKPFALQWHNHFHSCRECEKLPIPPVLETCIAIHWPSLQDMDISKVKPDHLHIADNGLRAFADEDDIKPLQQEPDGEPDGVDVQQKVVQPTSDHPLRVSKHVKLEVAEDGIAREVWEVSCDEPQHDSEWQCIG